MRSGVVAVEFFMVLTRVVTSCVLGSSFKSWSGGLVWYVGGWELCRLTVLVRIVCVFVVLPPSICAKCFERVLDMFICVVIGASSWCDGRFGIGRVHLPWVRLGCLSR